MELELGVEQPVHGRVGHGLDVTGGDVNPDVAVLIARFEHRYLDRRVFGQPVGEHATG